MGTFGTPSSYNNTGALGSATNPTTAQGLSRDRENQKAILELPGTQAWVEKTITDGVIIPTSAEIIVLPEGGASTDSLTTIVLTSDGTTTLHDGMPIRLKAANSNTITVVHGTGTNNISTIDGNNVVLDTTWYLELKLIGGLWVQQETSAYKTASEAKASAAAAQTLASGAYTLSGTSSTGASVAAKVVDLAGYVLRAGSSISVTFSNTNTVAGAITLNVNGTGAKSVYNQTGIISDSNTALFAANQPIEFRYDGTGWVFYDAEKTVLPQLASKADITLSNVDLNAVSLQLQRKYSLSKNFIAVTAVIPSDNTVPQITEGVQLFSLGITPKRADSFVEVDVTMQVSSTAAGINICAAVFIDSNANAVLAAVKTTDTTDYITTVRIHGVVQLSNTTTHTISVRAGTSNSSYPMYLNGSNSYTGLYGGALVSSLFITEYV